VYETLISNGMLQAANQEGSNRFRENKGITIIQQVLQRWVNGSYEPLGYFMQSKCPMSRLSYHVLAKGV